MIASMAADTLPRRKEILLCAENEVKAMWLGSIFAETDYRASLVDNARAVLDRVRSALPDLLVIDALTPVLDGRSLVRMLRAQSGTRSLPVIMLVPDGHRAVASDDAVLPLHGPISAPALLAHVARLLGDAAAERSPAAV